MTILTFSLLLFLIAYLAGFLGALTGLGGGIILIPILVLLFQVNIHYAMGASLISVIATSSGTAIASPREGYTNLHICVFLGAGAVIGALLSATLVTLISASALAIIFGIVLITSAYLTWHHRKATPVARPSHPWAVALKLEGTYPTPHGKKHYHVQRVYWGWLVMVVAGGLSGLLGIGSGALKVLAMDHIMGIPYKVATTASNFIIGITATVSAGIYFSHGYIEPGLTAPMVVGTFLGAFSGAKILARTKVDTLRLIFSITIFLLAIQMIYKGLTGNL